MNILCFCDGRFFARNLKDSDMFKDLRYYKKLPDYVSLAYSVNILILNDN